MAMGFTGRVSVHPGDIKQTRKMLEAGNTVYIYTLYINPQMYCKWNIAEKQKHILFLNNHWLSSAGLKRNPVWVVVPLRNLYVGARRVLFLFNPRQMWERQVEKTRLWGGMWDEAWGMRDDD